MSENFATIEEIRQANRFSPDNIKVYETEIMGKTVLALKDFCFDEIVCSYGGRLFSSDEAPESDYSLMLGRDLVMDGNPDFEESFGHQGMFINDAEGPIRCGKNNVRFSVGKINTARGSKKVVWIKAKEPICIGSHFHLSYGKQYWK